MPGRRLGRGQPNRPIYLHGKPDAADPIGKAGCIAWYTDRAAADNSTTTTWADVSGTGNDTTNGSSTVTHQTVEINGLPVERFPGATNGWLKKSSAVGLVSTWTVAVVHRPSNVTGPGSVLNFGNLAVSGPLLTLNGGRLQVWTSNGAPAAETVTLLVNGTVYRHVITCDAGGNVLIYTDGSLDTQSAAAQTFSYTTPAIQVGAVDATPLEFYNGDLGEIVLYGSVATSGERTSLFTYLGRWGAGASTAPTAHQISQYAGYF
jgi:Concanavalin A-like lectin/glucanases superfamily